MMTATTPRGLASLSMVVSGVGIGLVMKVMVLVAQNSVDRSDLGVATATVSFFRSLGGGSLQAVAELLAAQQLAATSAPGTAEP